MCITREFRIILLKTIRVFLTTKHSVNMAIHILRELTCEKTRNIINLYARERQ